MRVTALGQGLQGLQAERSSGLALGGRERLLAGPPRGVCSTCRGQHCRAGPWSADRRHSEKKREGAALLLKSFLIAFSREKLGRGFESGLITTLILITSVMLGKLLDASAPSVCLSIK